MKPLSLLTKTLTKNAKSIMAQIPLINKRTEIE